MEDKKLFIICFMLLIVAASFGSSSRASEDLNSKNIAKNEDNASSGGVSSQSIPCNWEGWKNSFPGVRCPSRPCDRSIQVLRMKCMNGFLTEVRVDRICIACQGPPGL
jgi:hypothetical protein